MSYSFCMIVFFHSTVLSAQKHDRGPALLYYTKVPRTGGHEDIRHQLLVRITTMLRSPVAIPQYLPVLCVLRDMHTVQ